MSLSAKEKGIVRATWAKISPASDAIGAEALNRMLHIYPQTKTYFSHWPDLAMGSKSVADHGKKVMGGIALAVASLDDLNKGLIELSERHAFQLRVDPANFKILNHCILVVLAMMFPKDFTPNVHLVMDKFLTAVALGLSERYR